MGREGVNRLDDMSGTAGDGAAAGVGAGAVGPEPKSPRISSTVDLGGAAG